MHQQDSVNYKRIKVENDSKMLTMDFPIALASTPLLLENKNFIFLGTSRGKGYEPLPLDTGTLSTEILDIGKSMKQSLHLLFYNMKTGITGKKSSNTHKELSLNLMQ